LEQLVRVVKEIPKLVTVFAENLRGEICRHLDTSDRRVLGHIPNFVDLDARITGEGRLQLLGERSGLGISAWKAANKSRKLRLGSGRAEVDAGNAGGCEELRKTALARRGTQWDTVQQDLIPRRTK
jgi:hypothetical protein